MENNLVKSAQSESEKVSSKRPIKSFEAEPDVLDMLKESLKHGCLPIDPQRRRRVIRRLRQVLGFDKWPKDITRHSAASYWLADTNNAAHVADMLGNSEKTLKAHYKAVVTREQSREFFNI